MKPQLGALTQGTAAGDTQSNYSYYDKPMSETDILAEVAEYASPEPAAPALTPTPLGPNVPAPMKAALSPTVMILIGLAALAAIIFATKGKQE